MRFFFPIIVICLCCLTFSCKPKGPAISPKVMVAVLKDINIAESYSAIVKDSLHNPGMKNTDSLAQFYREIFAHYHITEEEFNASMDWYKSNPESLDSLYTKIIPEIGIMETKTLRPKN